MHKLLFTILLVVISFYSFGNIVPVETAHTFAERFFIHRYNVSHENPIKEVNFKKVIHFEQNEEILYYIFNVENKGGFIIISAEDATLPVLAYAFEGEFYSEGRNEASEVFMKKYADQIRMAREQKIVSSKKIQAVWDEYLNHASKPNVFAFTTPLLSTNWDQDCYYNLYAPSTMSGPCNHAYIGCVATAMAQIMKYYDFPTTGYGSHNYIDPTFGTQSANFGATTYNWSQMPTQLGSSSAIAQKQAVSRLMKDCGVAVDMQYGANGSGTSTAFTPDAFSDYFRYNYAATEISAAKYTANQWGVILRAQINQNHPVLYSGSDYSIGYGHAWVMDGYQGSNYFHMNWGWSGYNNGFFLLTNLSVSSYDFTQDQDAVINIIPTGTGCSNNLSYISKSGRLEDGSGVANYGNNLNCSWLINPASSSVVVLNFDEFNTESSQDIVKVYDGTSTSGTLLGTFSGSNLPGMLIANSGSMYITFSTNGSVTKPGWKAHWSDQQPVYCTNLKFMTMATATFDDGSGKNNYLNNSQCKWLLKPSGASHVNLVFREFNLHTTDHLYVYNGPNTSSPLLGSFTGTNLPSALQSTGNAMLLYFVTGTSGVSSGWKVSYYKNSGLGYDDIKDASGLKIYPNPANDKLKIEFDGIGTQEVVLQLMDNQGRIIKNIKQTTFADSHVLSLDISDLSSGYYFLRFIGNNKLITTTFIKE